MKCSLYEIVIPLYNDEDNFFNLMESLKVCNVPKEKIIVVVSGSIGGVGEYAKKEGIRLCFEFGKLTPGDARNLGATLVSSEYIVFLDSDILVTESWKMALDELTSSGEKNLFGESYHLSSEPHWIERCWFEKIRKLSRLYINGGNLIIKKELFDELSGFNSRLETGEDYDLCKRSAERGHPCFIDKRLIVHHEGNPKSIKDFLRRENWHAKGDLVTFRDFMNSKVMIASTIYAVIVLLSIINLVLFNFLYFFVGVILVIALTVTLTVYKFGRKVDSFLKTVLVMNLYLLGRASALVFKSTKGLTGYYEKAARLVLSKMKR